MTWDIHALAHHVVISDFMDCNFKKSTGFSGRDVHHEMKPGGKRIFEKLRLSKRGKYEFDHVSVDIIDTQSNASRFFE